MENITSIEDKHGGLDTEKYCMVIDEIQEKIDELRKKAEKLELVPTELESGMFLWKTKQVNPEKLAQVSEIVQEQSELNGRFIETQQLAMMLSISSIEGMKTVHEKLTKLACKNSENNKKAGEQIMRVARFSKKYADMLENFEKQSEEKIAELQKKLSALIEQSVHDVSESVKSDISLSLQKTTDDRIYETEQMLKTELKDIQEKCVNKADFEESTQSLKTQLSNLQENTVQKSEFDDFRNEMKNVLESYAEKASLETELAAMREEINDLKEIHKKPRGWKAVLKIVGRN